MVGEIGELGASVAITTKGIGTIIRRKSVVNKKEYARMWIYVPQKVADDSQFPFKPGDPAEVEIDLVKKQLMVSQIDRAEATKRGWAARSRGTEME